MKEFVTWIDAQSTASETQSRTFRRNVYFREYLNRLGILKKVILVFSARFLYTNPPNHYLGSLHRCTTRDPGSLLLTSTEEKLFTTGYAERWYQIYLKKDGRKLAISCHCNTGLIRGLSLGPPSGSAPANYAPTQSTSWNVCTANATGQSPCQSWGSTGRHGGIRLITRTVCCTLAGRRI